MGARPVYFVHVPRSGGTTLISWIAARLGPERCYPSGDGEQVLAEKMFPAALADLTPERRAALRFVSPHLPAAVSELLGRPVDVATLVRDPVDQLRSSLDLQLGEDGDGDLMTRFEQSPNRWYSTHQLGWYLGTSLDQVLAVFERVATATGPLLPALDAAMRAEIGDRDLTGPACARLESMTLVGLTADADAFGRELAGRLGIEPPPESRRLNAGPGRRWRPGEAEQVAELLDAEQRIHARAVELAQRAVRSRTS